MDTHFLPAYGIDPRTHTNAPQCSGSPDFCFLCEFEAEPHSIGTDCDLYGSITEMAHHLADTQKEIPQIIRALHGAYNTTVRPHVTWDRPNGVTVKSPEWTQDSIRRHLTHSPEFGSLFHGIVTQIFHSIICSQNASMMENGMVVDDHRKAFLETVDGYRKWQAFHAGRGKAER